MAAEPLISICIPAYKNKVFLDRLLDSIHRQDFRDFEVIVSDDSPDHSVKDVCDSYSSRLPLQYHRNEKALGTPENWNAAVRRARAPWIKIMHDDDWFADAASLAVFADAIHRRPEASFFFSAYRDVFLDEDRSREMFTGGWRYRAFLKEHATLMSRNIVGPPSVTLYRNDPAFEYDPQVKWVVDIDFYIRYLEGKTPAYIPRILINVGIGSLQVTQYTHGHRNVEIPENFRLLNKLGAARLRNWMIYDAWWRLMRNLDIQRPQEIREAGYTGEVHPVILSMVDWQRRLSKRLLGIGPLSKSLMFLHYITHISKLPA